MQPLDRAVDDRGERAGERADPQRRPHGAGQLGDLRVGLGEPAGDRIGVREQQRARLGHRRAAGPAVEQPDAQLALERGDLLGDRGLRQGERLGRARERAAPGDLAEGEQAAGVDHRHSLWHSQEGNLS